jgi:hypothetical protein
MQDLAEPDDGEAAVSHAIHGRRNSTGFRDDVPTPQSPGLAGREDQPMADYFQNVRNNEMPSNDSDITAQKIQSTPATTTTVIAALQYLPVPVIVLSSLYTVVLANEAMGRLLGLQAAGLMNEGERDSVNSIPASDLLQGKTLQELGVTMLQNGLPIWVSWGVGYTIFIFPGRSYSHFFISAILISRFWLNYIVCAGFQKEWFRVTRTQDCLLKFGQLFRLLLASLMPLSHMFDRLCIVGIP